MIPVLSPDEAAELDRAAEARGISTSALMGRAGFELASAVLDVAGGAYGRRVVVVCGKGNNGGDGWVAARVLATAGAAVCVVALAEPAAGGAAAEHRARAARSTVRVRGPEALGRELARADVVVDAIVGTGFRGVAEGAVAEAIAALAASDRPVVSADIPSGVSGATGAVDGPAVRADVTVTFGAPKLGNVLLPGAALGGVLEIADIGFPPDLVRSDVGLLERSDVASWLPARRTDTHKRDAYAVVVGGSGVMTGAVTLATAAAYHAGAGLVAFAVPEPILRVVQPEVREAVAVPLPATDAGSAAGGSDRLDEVLAQADALAVGPGMTTAEETSAFVRELVGRARLPVVLDADGLNAFASRAEELAAVEAPVVLTPHAGEFARLAGVDAAEIERDRVAAARSLAARTGCVVLLKGPRTVIASPDGAVRINPTGGPFLATGGTGDVLTGVIVAFLARGLEPLDAASAAAYVHGLAGALAAEEAGEGTTAGQVGERIPEAIVEVAEG